MVRSAPSASRSLNEKPSLECIRRDVTKDEICVLTFDRPESSANLFDRAALLELDQHLNFISSDSSIKGLVLISAKKSIFIAGADIHALANGVKTDDLAERIELGQSVFNRIEALSIPTVAAIHGACLGGGYEITLACDYRIASPDRVTRIGLPETQLGILPAWGGSTRLPRLIGLPKALKVILSGKALAAQQALKAGLVDELVPREYLLRIASRKILAEGKRLNRRPTNLMLPVTNNALAARLMANRLGSKIVRKTRGHYPALFKALEVVTRGVSRSFEESLALEQAAMLELAQTEACRNLIRVFLLQERAKKLIGESRDNGEAFSPVKRIAVIGAGMMGAGIAQWSSSRELQVILREISNEQVAKSLSSIAHLYEQGARGHHLTRIEARAGMDRIFPVTHEVPLRNVDLVIEAAVEKLDLKKELFSRLDEVTGANTILATNTSALSISEIAASTKHPERVVGIHFFNPVHRMQLVEVVAGRQTDPEIVRRSVRFVQQIGKLPVVVKDSPGFLVNRILIPYLMEAGHLFALGARVEDIDEAMLEFGMLMGPLRLLDEIGLDVANHVVETLAARFGERLPAPVALSKMLQAGLLGRKSGHGFYVHHKEGEHADVNPDIDKFHHDTIAAPLSREELQSRMVLLILNEAARCLEEEVVAEPADVDFGMILGAGFAPFLGGPLRFADFVGVAPLVEEMDGLAEKGEPRFAPCLLLKTMARNGTSFYQAIVKSRFK